MRSVFVHEGWYITSFSQAVQDCQRPDELTCSGGITHEGWRKEILGAWQREAQIVCHKKWPERDCGCKRRRQQWAGRHHLLVTGKDFANQTVRGWRSSGGEGRLSMGKVLLLTGQPQKPQPWQGSSSWKVPKSRLAKLNWSEQGWGYIFYIGLQSGIAALGKLSEGQKPGSSSWFGCLARALSQCWGLRPTPALCFVMYGLPLGYLT